MGFSRVLNYFLKKYHDLTMALLTGLMAGSILKIWPWKEVLETRIIRGKVHTMVDRNILPPAFDTEVAFAIVLAIIGFLAVLVIEGLSKKRA